MDKELSKRATFIFLPILLLLVTTSSVVFVFFPGYSVTCEPLHALLETASATISIILFALLYNFRKYFQDKTPKLFWALSGFMILGMFDLMHAGQHIGNNFVLLQAIGALLGGLCFALVWAPSFNEPDAQKISLMSVGFIALVVGSILTLFPDITPIMLERGELTWLPKAMHFTAGIGFFMGMIYYFLNYRSSYIRVSLFLSIFCFVHALASFTSDIAMMWDINWWLWHFLRLFVYVLVFISYYRMFEVLIDEFYDLNKKLAKANSTMARANVTPTEDIFPKPEFNYETNHQDAIGKLASSMVHELNNILNAIVNTAYLIQDKYKEDDYLARKSEMIINTSLRGADATKQFSIFSNYDKAEESIFDFREVIQDIQRASEVGLSEKRKIEFVVDKDPLFIHSDFSRLYQVLMNLVLNVCESIPENHTIAINAYVVHNQAETAKEWVIIKIYDKGNRISDDKIKEIFNAFEGIKLEDHAISSIHIAEEIFRFLGGRLEVSSKENDDACITISFPYIAETSASKLKNKLSRKSMHNLLRGKRVLVLDDEAYIAETTREILEMCGGEVHTAMNASEAEILLETQNEFDLALLDVMLPDKTGIEFWHEIEHIYPDLRVIFMSGYSDKALVESIQDNANITFIQKPFMPNDLLVQIGTDLELLNPNEIKR